MPLPKSKLHQLLLVPTWLTASVTTFALGTWLLVNFPSPPNFLNLSNSLNQSNYSLFAALPEGGSVLGQNITSGDSRVVRLHNFLADYRSPLTPYAEHLVATADRYQLPWALLPAIAGKESGYCRVIPYNSHNCWGWAVFTGQNSGAAWDNYEHAIETVAKGLREDYFDQGLDTIAEIEARYTPQSATRDNSWRYDVKAIMQAIEGTL